MSGKQVIPKEDMVAKIKAAVDSRESDDFLIIARCDALAVNGWDDAIERGRAYEEAGADMIFIEAPETIEQMEEIPGLFKAPCLINMAPRTPSLPAERLEKMGYAIAIFPAICLAASEHGRPEDFQRDGPTARLRRFSCFIHAVQRVHRSGPLQRAGGEIHVMRITEKAF
jgi:2-methylisocitrate lyase-like PEP mutase family enzyme